MTPLRTLRTRAQEALAAARTNGYFLPGRCPSALDIAQDMASYCADLEDEDPAELARVLTELGLEPQESKP